MAESFFSSVWYRIAELRPRLAPRIEVSRHRFRGRGWYVVHDPATGRVHRFTPAAWLMIGRMTGRVSIDALWREAVETLGEDAPSQDDVVRLLAQLHGAELIRLDIAPETAGLLERLENQTRSERRQRLMNPLSIRIPIWNPDRFLTRTAWVGRVAFSRVGAMVWALVVLAGAVTAGMNWPELTGGLLDRVMTAQNLLVLWLAYPFVKALHELGHGWAAKRYGTELRDMGIMFLMFFPVPYVDASSAAALPDKRQRALVAAAGIVVELFLAALAVMAWAVLEPGLARSVAFNVALIGGVSTVLVNGNPLLRFDGYYVLSDLAESPNLAQRATRLWGRLAERYLFGAPPEPLPGEDGRERALLLIYAPLAYVYRLLLSLSIALIVASKAFGLGILLAIWSLFLSLVMPLFRILKTVVSDGRLAKVRRRAVSVTAGGVAVALALVLAVPLPMSTLAEGVVWLPERSELRAGTDGFVETLVAAPGAEVTAGAPLMRLSEPVIATRIDLAQARVDQAQAQYRAMLGNDRLRAAVLREQVAEAGAQLARQRDERARLDLVAPVAGRFVVPRAADLPGRFVRRGELLGHVIEPALRRVRIAVPQERVDLVRGDTRGVRVLLIADSGESLPAHLVREVPAAANRLPNPAFTSFGGGAILADPNDPEGMSALESQFLFDIELDRDLPAGAFGSHARVRLSHGWRPLGWQLYRKARVVILRRLDV